MYLALIQKELREVLPTVVIASAAYLVAVGSSMQSWFVHGTPLSLLTVLADEDDIAFESISFLVNFLLISLGFCSILGFQQSQMEEWRGTFRLFLHRPLPRGQLIGLKLLTGLGVYLLVGSATILMLACWAATPGMQPAPFLWSMTGPTLLVLLAAPVVYLGAFLSSLRPSRWYGTKLLPWLVSFAPFLVIFYGDGENPTGLAFLLWGLVVPLLVANLLWVIQQREFD